MLLLTRRRGERILIGDDVEIIVLKVGDNQVTLGISAPLEIKIVRAEVHDPDRAKQRE